MGCDKRGAAFANRNHSSEAPKMISAAAALVMKGDKLAPKRSQVGETPLVAVDVVVAPVVVGVVSPSTLEAFPRSELAKEHTWRMLLTSEGRLVVFRTAV